MAFLKNILEDFGGYEIVNLTSGWRAETQPCLVGTNCTYRAMTEKKLAAPIQTGTNEGRANNNHSLPRQNRCVNTASELRVMCLHGNMLGGLLSLVWQQFQDFFFIWHSTGYKLTVSLFVFHLHPFFISQINCGGLINQLRLMLPPPVRTRHLKGH